MNLAINYAPAWRLASKEANALPCADRHHYLPGVIPPLFPFGGL
jgi:hypothetical protein